MKILTMNESQTMLSSSMVGPSSVIRPLVDLWVLRLGIDGISGDRVAASCCVISGSRCPLQGFSMILLLSELGPVKTLAVNVWAPSSA